MKTLSSSHCLWSSKVSCIIRKWILLSSRLFVIGLIVFPDWLFVGYFSKVSLASSVFLSISSVLRARFPFLEGFRFWPTCVLAGLFWRHLAVLFLLSESLLLSELYDILSGIWSASNVGFTLKSGRDVVGLGKMSLKICKFLTRITLFCSSICTL